MLPSLRDTLLRAARDESVLCDFSSASDALPAQWALRVAGKLFPSEVSRGMVHMYETLLHKRIGGAVLDV